MGERMGSGKILADRSLPSTAANTFQLTRSGLEVDANQWTRMLDDLDIQDMTMEGFEPRLPEDDFPDDLAINFDPFPGQPPAADQSLQVGFEPVSAIIDLLSVTLRDDPLSTTFDLEGQITTSSPEQSFNFGSSTMEFEHGFMVPNTGRQLQVTLTTLITALTAYNLIDSYA